MGVLDTDAEIAEIIEPPPSQKKVT